VWRNRGLLDEEAEELLKEMLEICARAYGYDNPWTWGIAEELLACQKRGTPPL